MSTRALRYYEQQGLIHSQRQANGYREYRLEDVDVVAFIQDLFAVGLSSQLLREIIPCAVSDSNGPPPAELLTQVEKVRDDLVQQEQRLRLRRQALDAYLADRTKPRSPRHQTYATS